MQNSKTNYGLEEAGMAQMDDSVGALLSTWTTSAKPTTPSSSSRLTTAPKVHLADGGMTPFKSTKGTA